MSDDIQPRGDDIQPRGEEPMFEGGPVDETSPVERVAVGPGDGTSAAADPLASGDGSDPLASGDGASDAPAPAAELSGPDLSLLALVDRLTAVLERTDLGELELAAGGTTIVLRAPSAVERPVALAPAPADVGLVASATQGATDGTPSAPNAAPAPPAARPSVKAPLTGIYYGAPSPGATPYLAVGDHVAVGQTIGLIEAMKLFNEIKSDLAGRVVRICADNGALVKAKQPLIEVEPA